MVERLNFKNAIFRQSIVTVSWASILIPFFRCLTNCIQTWLPRQTMSRHVRTVPGKRQRHLCANNLPVLYIYNWCSHTNSSWRIAHAQTFLGVLWFIWNRALFNACAFTKTQDASCDWTVYPLWYRRDQADDIRFSICANMLLEHLWPTHYIKVYVEKQITANSRASFCSYPPTVVSQGERCRRETIPMQSITHSMTMYMGRHLESVYVI